MAAPHPVLLPLLRGHDLAEGATIDKTVVVSAEEHLVAGLVDDVVTQRAIDVEPAILLRLARSGMAAAAENATAITAVDTVLEAAASVDVGVGFFKGVVTGAMHYSNPAARPTIDVDVFVDPGGLDRMADLARALGASDDTAHAIGAMVAERRIFEVPIRVGDTEVDLHRDPMNMILPSRGEQARWATTVEATLANGRTVRTLDPEWSTVHALLHGFRDNFADLLHIHDLALMFEAHPDWDRIDALATSEGWRDLVRYATAFVSDVLGEPSPLPRRISRISMATIRTFWPRHLLLQGAESLARSHRRQSAIGLLTHGRTGELAAAYTRRIFPRREIIDHRAEPTNAAYPVALYEWRMSQRRTNRDRTRSADGDDETL